MDTFIQLTGLKAPEEMTLQDLISGLTGDFTSTSRGWNVFFDDGHRRIDFILVWKQESDKDKDAITREKYRKFFVQNLHNEGLETEEYHRDGKDEHFLKVHAPFEVLTRYAEIMKTRMPIKEVPEEIQTASLWEMVSYYFYKLFRPFQLDETKVPLLPKKFTHVFERDKSYLFAIPDKDEELFFSHSQRSLIVDYILRRTKYSGADDKDSFAFGIKRLLQNSTYLTAYPLHEGEWQENREHNMRKLLYDNWAYWRRWYKLQPLDYIRIYFGEKIGLYFAWLGYYTYMLIPASVVGLIVFIYGLVTVKNNTVADESCDFNNNFTMCPKCDIRCEYWNYALACNDVRASHMFDNGATVFFAIFMSFWGTFFLEFWKREQASIQFKWNTMNFEEEEQPPRPEYLLKLSNSRFKRTHRVTGKEEPFLPLWRRRIPVYLASASTMIFLITVAVAIIIGVYVYRMIALTTLYARKEEILYSNASMVTTATAACLNLLAILILNFIYSRLAVVLTDWECLRTQSEYDSSLTFKLYVLQFVNYYSSLFYIAFFKGRFTGRPGAYNTFAGARQEECSMGGCLIELVIQLAIIFVGKQLIQNTLLEILLPKFKSKLNEWCFTKEGENIDPKTLKPWEKDFNLEDPGFAALFHEYLEMMIQFGFVTIFVAAFPLAPLFAVLNNILEIRTDANKFCTAMRRPLGIRAATIGIWYDILICVSRIAVLSNAFIISFTTGFIDRLVYVYGYSDEKGSLKGYVNQTLAYFNVSDFSEGSRPDDPAGKFNSVEICRYQDYREPPWSSQPYTYTTQFWHVLAAQFIFVVIFENVVIVITNFIAYVIPDMPRKLGEQVRREAYLVNEIILRTERDRAKGTWTGGYDDNIGEAMRRRANANLMNRNLTPSNGDLEAGGDMGEIGPNLEGLYSTHV